MNNRYKDQNILCEIGEKGFFKIRNSNLIVIGAGGLGHPVCSYLVSVGVGALTICDGDKVEKSNLNRQFQFNSQDIGKYKASTLANKLRMQNFDVKISHINKFINRENLKELLLKFDYIIDCSDNFKTKFLLHDFCFVYEKNYLQSSVFKYEGKILNFPFAISRNICWRCLYPEIPESKTCKQTGSLGPVLGVLGSMLALEIIKQILNINPLPAGSELIVDLYSSQIKKMSWTQNNNCYICSNKKGDSFLTTNMSVQNENGFDKIIDVSLDDFKMSSISKFKRNEVILFKCQTAELSYSIVYNLRRRGYKSVYYLDQKQINIEDPYKG